uniref:Uncharacterized protein n=1 Tax=Arundo donax TaxID=35708 RepID=A0A0A9DEF6_ARUDO
MLWEDEKYTPVVQVWVSLEFKIIVTSNQKHNKTTSMLSCWFCWSAQMGKFIVHFCAYSCS